MPLHREIQMHPVGSQDIRETQAHRPERLATSRAEMQSLTRTEDYVAVRGQPRQPVKPPRRQPATGNASRGGS